MVNLAESLSAVKFGQGGIVGWAHQGVVGGCCQKNLYLIILYIMYFGINCPFQNINLSLSLDKTFSFNDGNK